MSNIKSADIKGRIPFNAGDNQELLSLIGRCNLPGFGLRIEFDYKTHYIPNEHGGETAMYDFCLHGQEAVRREWLEHFVESVKKGGGEVFSAQYSDIEAGQGPFHL